MRGKRKHWQGSVLDGTQFDDEPESKLSPDKELHAMERGAPKTMPEQV